MQDLIHTLPSAPYVKCYISISVPPSPTLFPPVALSQRFIVPCYLRASWQCEVSQIDQSLADGGTQPRPLRGVPNTFRLCRRIPRCCHLPCLHAMPPLAGVRSVPRSSITSSCPTPRPISSVARASLRTPLKKERSFVSPCHALLTEQVRQPRWTHRIFSHVGVAAGVETHVG